MKPSHVAVGLLFVSPVSACVSPAQIVIVDRATALEEQAGGSFDDLERKLIRGGIAPRPVAFTPEELEALGARTRDLENTTEQTQDEQVDALLRQRCLGEGKEGLLLQTPAACEGAADPDVLQQLAEHENRARTLLWRWLVKQRPERSLAEVQQAWQAAHGRGLVCGAWRQRADGTWEPKGC